MDDKPQHSQIQCREAVESSFNFLIKHFENARCDSDAVSNCVRCQTVFLAKSVREMLLSAQSAALGDRSEK